MSEAYLVLCVSVLALTAAALLSMQSPPMETADVVLMYADNLEEMQIYDGMETCE